MSDPISLEGAAQLRGRARLLEFLKFRVLASQESFFDAWRAEPPLAGDSVAPAPTTGLPPLDPIAFRQWLEPLWPEAMALSDSDLRHCLEQAHRLYVDPPLRRQP